MYQVREGSGREMRLAFVSRENAACGFTSSTFSFNLPKPDGASEGACAALAQRFVFFTNRTLSLRRP